MQISALAVATAFLASACITSNGANQIDAESVGPIGGPNTVAPITKNPAGPDPEGVIRDSDSVTIALDPLTDRLMYEEGFNGAIVSGPDNNSHVILLFETKEDLERFRRDMAARKSEFRKIRGQWHFTYRGSETLKSGPTLKIQGGLVRIKLDVEQFVEDEDSAH